MTEKKQLSLTDNSGNVPAKPEEPKVTEQVAKNYKPWQNALIKAENKFLAINPERTKVEMGFASQLIQQSQDLQKCTLDSIVNAVVNVARTGITLNPIMKLAHLIPRKKKIGEQYITECILDFDYKGLVKILKDYGCLKDIQAIIVYEDEVFEESNSPVLAPNHIKIYAKTEEEQKKREYKGVYSQVLLMDNTVIYTQFTPYWQILKAEKSSQSATSSFSPWKNWREEMICKTKIKKDFKTLVSGSADKNEKLSAVLEIENNNEGFETIPKNKKSIADTFGEETTFEEAS